MFDKALALRCHSHGKSCATLRPYEGGWHVLSFHKPLPLPSTQSFGRHGWRDGGACVNAAAKIAAPKTNQQSCCQGP
jgi:hypothetical protein